MEQDLNVAKCVVEKNHWGYDTMVNFCTGKSVDVPWVTSDYIAAVFVIGIVVAIALMLLAAIISMVSDR